MTSSYFGEGIRSLEFLGLMDVLLPFLLIFTIVFAVLQKSEIFGTDKKNFNVMIALIMGLAVVIPHVTGMYPGNWDVVDIINKSLPNVSLLMVAIIMVILLLGIFGAGTSWKGSSITGVIALIAFIAVIYIFGAAAELWGINNRIGFLSDPDVQALVVVILVFGILVWFITKEEKTQGRGMFESLGDLFSKK